jgi:phosphoribosylglycinamide formyltransferase-1
MSERVGVAVLISGSGTNLQALLDAAAAPDWPGRIALVISNRRDAFGLERARAAGVPALWIPHRGKSKEEFETELLAALDEHGVQWVALAGFMRLLSGRFLSHFPNRVLNIHPALLPAFPGLHAPEQALEAGVRVSGATVHLVDEGTDTGPIICQGAVPVLPGDDLDSLKARILTLEHQLYPLALRWAVEGRLQVKRGRIDLDLTEGERAWLWFG